jgi:DNA-binding NtrC family response regulator
VSGRYILVVDDESLIRWSMRSRLEAAGFRVAESESGSRALSHVAHEPDVGVIFLDLRLPDMDGLTVLKQVRQLNPACPVVIMTAYGSPEARHQASDLGVTQMLDKPFSYDDIVRLAGELLPKQAV